MLRTREIITVLLPSSSGTIALTTDIPNVPVDSVNGQTGVVVLDTGDIDENGNLYYTEARVAANSGCCSQYREGGDHYPTSRRHNRKQCQSRNHPDSSGRDNREHGKGRSHRRRHHGTSTCEGKRYGLRYGMGGHRNRYPISQSLSNGRGDIPKRCNGIR